MFLNGQRVKTGGDKGEWQRAWLQVDGAHVQLFEAAARHQPPAAAAEADTTATEPAPGMLPSSDDEDEAGTATLPQSSDDEGAAAAAAAATAAAAPPVLPAGWETRVSNSTGDTYYINVDTGETGAASAANRHGRRNKKRRAEVMVSRFLELVLVSCVHYHSNEGLRSTCKACCLPRSLGRFSGHIRL